MTEAGTFKPLPIDLRAGTVATVDPKTGKVWAQRFDPRRRSVTSAASWRPPPSPATVGANPAIAADDKGNVHVVSGRTGQVVTPPRVPTASPNRSPSRPHCAVRTLTSRPWHHLGLPSTRPRTASSPPSSLTGVEGTRRPRTPRVRPCSSPGPTADAGRSPALSARPHGGGSTAAHRAVASSSTTRSTVTSRALSSPDPLSRAGCLHAACPAGQVFYGANCGRDGQVPTARRQRQRGAGPARAWPSGSTETRSSSTTSTTARSGTSTTAEEARQPGLAHPAATTPGRHPEEADENLVETSS